MEARAAVLAQFDEPLQMRNFPLVPLAEGEVRVKITCAGVCGSDVHMWRGEDPRTPLPMILGHEGVGEVAEIAGEKTDLFGRPLHEGDPVLWERGVMCGECSTARSARSRRFARRARHTASRIPARSRRTCWVATVSICTCGPGTR